MNLSIRAKSITEQEPNLAVITAILVTEIYRSNQSSNFSPHELVWTVIFPRHRRQNSPDFEPSCQELRWDQTSSTRMEHPDRRRSCNNKVRQDLILVPKLAQIRTYHQLSSIPLPIWIQFWDVGVATVTYGDQLLCGKIIKQACICTRKEFRDGQLIFIKEYSHRIQRSSKA